MQSSKDAELVESTNDQPNTDCNLNSGAGADEGLFCGAATLQFVSFGWPVQRWCYDASGEDDDHGGREPYK